MIKTSACMTVSCDACGYELQDDLILHFDNISDARECATGSHDWFFAESGSALCGSEKANHLDVAREIEPRLGDEERELLHAVYPSLAPDWDEGPAAS